MKKVFTTILIVFISTLLFAQSFYRYQGTRIDLSLDSNLYVVQPNSQLVEKQNSAFEEKLQKGEIGFFKKIPNNRFLVGGAKLQPENYDYISNVYRDDGNGMVIILPRIAVMFKQEVNLQQVLDKYDGKLIKDGGGNRKYILKCDVSHSEEVLKLVSELDTRDDVIWCEPEFLSDYRANNTLYPQQYYLKNTGQNGGTAGIDINVEPAWNLTNGNSCITVAVIDVGVDRNHEDMGTRVLEGFTIRNATGEGEAQNANSLDSKYHGMACAGIVAASNNTIGIRGVASNVNILPVNIAPDATYIDGLGRRIEGFGTNIEIAEAIGWAWRRADVLSCSWGGGSPSNDITAAIDSARTFGRNGNGTVVVFSSGNNYPGDTDVLYPGRVNGVVTVGAITNQGTICNYSQRGTSMDLVAPSGDANSNNNVTTTDRMGSLGEETSGNYMNDFGGTSAACPQVSGVAALMLLVNPNLTEAQVLTILQQTATDMGTSGFDNTYGHGRVNAYAAVIRAMGGPITGPSVICTSGTTLSITPLAAPDSIIWSCGPNLAISSGQNTTSCNLSITGNGSSWVRARLVSACGSVTLPQKTVWVGTPIVTSVTGASPLGVYQPATYYAELSSFSSMPDSYYWATSPSSGVTITSYGHYASIMFTRSGWYQVVAKAHNACGWSSYAMKM
ncbi:MAG: S8 family serine peptidase, partial [Bacteroidota bacterium]|nr:S8 family serine peptidase [Bacteroidota bacterium]